MNPTDWQYTHQRQRESLDPRQMTGKGKEGRNSKEKIIYPYCGYSVNDRRLHAEMEHQNPSSHRSYRLKSNHFTPEKATDPDGEPVEPSNVDGELARKRRELQQIVKQICLKKATIAMKTTEPFLKAKTPCQMFKEEREEALSLSKVDNSVKNTQPFMSTRGKDVGFSCSKWSSTYNNRPLKERVNVMLQRRYPDRFRAKAFSTPYDHLPSPNPVEKINMSTLNKDDHPLKLRVKALMNRRRNSGVLDSHGEVPVVKPHPPSQSPSTTVVGNDLVFKGFQRFLNILNKVVDVEALTKIVNGDKELPLTGQELLHSQPPVVKERLDVCKSESQRLQRGAGQRDRRSCSKERKTELLNQDISHGGGKRNIKPEEKSAQSDDRGGSHFGSSRRYRSPPVVEEKKPKLEQHQEELQNILKTIGFSLEADDMCKLAERTQERLYGRKHETKQSLDSTGVSKRSQQHVQSDHSRSSSSTSVSVSPSSSPSHHQHSYSETFRDSREQARDGNRDNKRIDPYPEDPEYHVPYPDAASAVQTYNSDVASAIPTHFGPYTLVQHSEYTASAYHSYYSNGSSSITWNYGSNVIPPSSSYPPGFCNSVNRSCPSANTGSLLGEYYPPSLPAGHNNVLGHSCFNADLSLSEGQSGQRSGPHYLHVINTGKSNGTGGCMAQVNMKHKAKPSKKKRLKKRSGITTNTLLPEPPVGVGTGQQKRTATRVINTETSSGTAFSPTQLNKKSSKSARRAKRRREREQYITKKPALTDVQVQSVEKEIEEQKERELMTVAVALGCSSANSQKDPAPMQTRQLRSGIKYPTDTLHSEPPVEASTEVQQKKTATHVINTQTSSGAACCLTDMKVANTESVKYNFEEYRNAAQKLFQEMKKLKSTASWIARYIRLAKSNHAEYSESKQRNTLKWLLKKQRRTEELREENKRELDMILLYSYPPDESSTEAQQLEGDLPTEELFVKSKEKFAAFKKEMAEMTLALADSSSIIDEKDPAQIGKIDFPSGITTNNLNPELPGEDTSEAGQMERALPTEEQMKDNLKEKNSDRSLSECQTGQQFDRGHPHAINAIQHSEQTDYHSDTSNRASLTARNHGSNDIPPPPSSSFPPVLRICHQRKKANKRENKRKRKLLQIKAKRSLQKRLKEQLTFVRNSIARANSDPANNSEEQQKILEKLAGLEQNILKTLEQNSDLSLNEGQTGQQSTVDTVTKAKFEREEKGVREAKKVAAAGVVSSEAAMSVQ